MKSACEGEREGGQRKRSVRVREPPLLYTSARTTSRSAIRSIDVLSRRREKSVRFGPDVSDINKYWMKEYTFGLTQAGPDDPRPNIVTFANHKYQLSSSPYVQIRHLRNTCGGGGMELLLNSVCPFTGELEERRQASDAGPRQKISTVLARRTVSRCNLPVPTGAYRRDLEDYPKMHAPAWMTAQS